MIDADFGHWLAGFIDGEGCFTIEITNKRRPVVRFSILVRMDDAEIVREIHRRLGVGKVYLRPARYHTDLSPKAKPQIVWRVQRVHDCQRLAEVLDAYPLRAKKKRDYAIWRLALDDMLAHQLPTGARKGRENPRDDAYLERVAGYRDALKAVREYEGPDDEEIEIMREPQLRLVGGD